MQRIIILFMLFVSVIETNAQELNYYLPDSVSYDPAVPKPKEVIFHEVGEYHVTHDRLVQYMRAVAAAVPSRIRLETMGFTYERRPQVLLIITSPENHQRLEEIRQQHLLLSDVTKSGAVNIENMPIVVYIGHSIHGNEPSGANASLLTTYYLAAAKGRAIEELLKNVVILLDPSFNPDGMQRFSTWANQHRGKNLVSDPNSREFNEVWPGGRFNHYWFDLNRDWLPSVHVESRNRLEWFHKWKPNILTDHHEQGSNATFFFQPGVPSRVNPLTPARNQELTGMLGKYHARNLDRIGSLYFTKESYDDFYYGKGSTYPDINGGIGILFEQASSRGHLQQTANGLLSFPFTIRNQFVTALSTLEGANALRREFLQWQREFYKLAATDAAADPVKAYVFGDAKDRTRTNEFVNMLLRQQINVYRSKESNKVDGSYIVPINQGQYKVIKTIFETVSQFRDSLFYDITSWTMPLAFGLEYSSVDARFNAGMLGERVQVPLEGKGMVKGGEGNYAYAMRWNQLNAPAAMYAMQQEGIQAKVATRKFSVEGESEFSEGTILIPVKQQSLESSKLFEHLKAIVEKYDVDVSMIASGNATSGIDLGSGKFVAVPKPVIAMLVGPGVSATDAGEVWHLLDQRMNIPASQLESSVFNRVDMNKYNTLIMVGGAYDELNKEKLKSWVQGGGTLILTEEAVSWASRNGISRVVLKSVGAPVDSSKRLGYAEREQIDGAQAMSGAIFGAEVDLTHPLAFGYDRKLVSLFKGNAVFMERGKNPYATPYYYGKTPLQSGWVSRENLEAIRNSAAVLVNTVGTGRVVNIADNPNFRAFWLGGSKLFMNAIYFGRITDAAAGRTE